MAEALRGSRLGARSYETDAGMPSAPAQLTTYVCPVGHQETFPFSVEADEIPDTWQCHCGRTAVRLGVTDPQLLQERALKTHWDMLMERRTRAELTDLLKERVELLRRRSA